MVHAVLSVSASTPVPTTHASPPYGTPTALPAVDGQYVAIPNTWAGAYE